MKTLRIDSLEELRIEIDKIDDFLVSKLRERMDIVSKVATLKKNSLEFLKIKITPHCLRHSSATFYAREFDGNMNLLAQRYGWTFSSKQLQTYIRRSGAYQKAGAKKVFTNEVAKVKEQNVLLKERLEKLESIMGKYQHFDRFLNVILEDKDIQNNIKKKIAKLH